MSNALTLMIACTGRRLALRVRQAFYATIGPSAEALAAWWDVMQRLATSTREQQQHEQQQRWCSLCGACAVQLVTPEVLVHWCRHWGDVETCIRAAICMHGRTGRAVPDTPLLHACFSAVACEEHRLDAEPVRKGTLYRALRRHFASQTPPPP